MKKAKVIYDIQKDYFVVRIYENKVKVYDDEWHEYFDNIVVDLYDFHNVEPHNIDIDFMEWGSKKFSEWGLNDIKESKVKLMSTLVEIMDNYNKTGKVITNYGLYHM